MQRLLKEKYTCNEVLKFQLSKCSFMNNYVAIPNSDNLFEWTFLIFGLENTEYDGGYYMGKIYFPSEFPFKAPSIVMKSQTGRFDVNTRIEAPLTDLSS